MITNVHPPNIHENVVHLYPDLEHSYALHIAVNSLIDHANSHATMGLAFNDPTYAQGALEAANNFIQTMIPFTSHTDFQFGTQPAHHLAEPTKRLRDKITAFAKQTTEIYHSLQSIHPAPHTLEHHQTTHLSAHLIHYQCARAAFKQLENAIAQLDYKQPSQARLINALITVITDLDSSHFPPPHIPAIFTSPQATLFQAAQRNIAADTNKTLTHLKRSIVVALKRHNLNMFTHITPKMQHIEHSLDEITDIDLHPRYGSPGFHCDGTVHESCAAHVGFIHHGIRIFKTVNEPYSEGISAYQADQHMATCATALTTIPPFMMAQHQFDADIGAMAHAARLGLHTTTPQQIAELLHHAVDLGLRPGDVQLVLGSITQHDQHLAKFLTSTSRYPDLQHILCDPETARHITATAIDHGLDSRKLTYLAGALGYTMDDLDLETINTEQHHAESMRAKAAELGIPNQLQHSLYHALTGPTPPAI